MSVQNMLWGGSGTTCCTRPRSVLARSGAPSRKQTLALKEWNVSVAAIEDSALGQTVLLRKGGIKEPTFLPKSDTFFFFPTTFHTDGTLLQERVPDHLKQLANRADGDGSRPDKIKFRSVVRLTGAWSTRDPKVLEETKALHVWGPGFADKRLKWRGEQPVTLLEVRAFLLAEPVTVLTKDEYFGCFSWVHIDDPNLPDVLQKSAIPVLSENAWEEKKKILRQALERLSDVEDVMSV